MKCDGGPVGDDLNTLAPTVLPAWHITEALRNVVPF